MSAIEIATWPCPAPLSMPEPRPPQTRPSARSTDPSKANRLTLSTTGDEGTLRLGDRGLVWDMQPDHSVRVAVYLPAKGSGFCELVVWAPSTRTGALLLTSGPYSAEMADWFTQAGRRIAQLLGLRFESIGCADA